MYSQLTKSFPNWTISDILMILCRFSKMAAMTIRRHSTPSQIYFRFPVLWHHVTHLGRYKFWSDISIHSRNITTSGCRKQTSAILKYFSRFRFWPFYRHRHVILHRPAKFCTKQTTRNSYDIISIFQNSGYTVANLLPFPDTVMTHVSEDTSCLRTEFWQDISI